MKNQKKKYITPLLVIFILSMFFLGSRCPKKPGGTVGYYCHPDKSIFIRSVNMKGNGWPRYSGRCVGMANVFYLQNDSLIGAIGLQEAKTETNECPISPKNDVGSNCFSRIIQNVFNKSSSSYSPDIKKNLGIVVGYPLEIIKNTERWDRIGEDHCVRTAFPDWHGEKRYLIWVKIKHIKSNYELFFFNTHLSHDANDCDHEGERYSQVNQIIERVKEQHITSQYDLPPILVGDFNFDKDPEDQNSKNLLNEWFRLVSQSGVDRIYAGRLEKFPKATKGYSKEQSFVTYLRDPIKVDAAFWGSIQYVYLFNNSNYFRLEALSKVNSYTQDDPSYWHFPGLLPIDRYWHDWPNNYSGQHFNSEIDAALIENGYAYFFDGDMFLKYDLTNDKVMSSYPKLISSEWNLPDGFRSNFDAAVSGLGPFSGDVYFFKGTKYLKCKLSTKTAYSGYPRTIKNDWNLSVDGFDFNNGVDAAFSVFKPMSMINRYYVYFFKEFEITRESGEKAKESRVLIYDILTSKAIKAGTIKSIFKGTAWPGDWTDHNSPTVSLCFED